MFLLALYALLALVAPYVVFRLFAGSDSVVYQGKVTVANIGLLDKGARRTTTYNFVTAFLPDGSNIVFEQSKARLASLKEFVQHPTLTIKQSLLGGRYVSSVTWPEDGATVNGDTRNSGFYMSLAYLGLSLAALIFAMQPGTIAQVGNLGLVYSGFLFGLSAFFLARDKVPAIGVNDEMSSLYFFKLGKGKSGVVAATVIASAITAVSFYIGGPACFVGLSALYSLGMLISMLTKR